MKKLAYFSIVFMLCMGLTGCAVDSSSNMARLKSDNLTAFGPWGYVHGGNNTTVTFYSGRQAATKDAKEKIDWPSIPNIQEDANSNFNIGKPMLEGFYKKKVTVPEVTPGVVEAITGIGK